MLPRTIAGIIVSLAVFLSHTTWAQLPKSAVIGTNPAGTVFYALAGGLAKVASEATPIQVNIQPYTGTSTFLPLVNNGELDLAIVNAVDMGMAYLGPQKAQSRRQKRLSALSQSPSRYARRAVDGRAAGQERLPIEERS